jgi:hypothetical protein
MKEEMGFIADEVNLAKEITNQSIACSIGTVNKDKRVGSGYRRFPAIQR